jgi:hypothetical protein
MNGVVVVAVRDQAKRGTGRYYLETLREVTYDSHPAPLLHLQR